MNGYGPSSSALAWLLWVAPLLTVIIAAIGAYVAFKTMQFRTKVDSAGQWWARVQNAIDHCLADNTREQNLGTTMLDHLQAQGEMPEGLDEAQQREWQRINKMRWSVQPEDLLMIHGIVKDLALSQSKRLSSMGIRLNPEVRPEYDTLLRQAQLVLKIDAKLGREGDPEIVKLLTIN